MNYLRKTLLFLFISLFILVIYLDNRIIKMDENSFGNFLEEKVDIKDLITLKEETNTYYILSYKPNAFNVFFIIGMDINYLNIKINKQEIKINKNNINIGDYVFQAGCQNLFIFFNYQLSEDNKV